eukprot:TRINITY_DN68017_c0_g1_i1.p1 TRINITY_DN68017_c0_g1~~TRINITY_DN68017_c0_g1_i1.p1  ORF type:complete len:348 (+),score=72.03 TRINITY_DN68017_c0_g1_i1:110-1153(+)
MNKARAMLDALMGPNRDERERDKEKAKEKFKDSTVCKSFLIGLCPMDPTYLGGKRQFKACQKIHSEIMKDQFGVHPDFEKLRLQYEAEAIPGFEKVLNDCTARVAEEKVRIREDWGNRRPPLAADVISKIHAAKRASRLKAEAADALEDSQVQEKNRLMKEADELAKEADAMEEKEMQKAKEEAVPEEVCEICGTSYQGSAGNAAHKKFKVHIAYQEIRDKLGEMSERAEKEKSKKRKAGDSGADERAEVERDSRRAKREGSRDREREPRSRKAPSRARDSRSRGVRDGRDREPPPRARDSRGRGGKDWDLPSRGRDSRTRGRGGRDRARDSRSRGTGVRDRQGRRR